LKASSRKWKSSPATCRRPSPSRRTACTTTWTSGTTENGSVPRPAREPGGGRAVRARRLLDCFTYNGGFALPLAPKCKEVIAFDVSEEAIARTRENAAKNGVTIDARVGNVFDELRGLDRLGERFDTIVLDPPAFAKNKAAVANARTGYKEINLRALKLLNHGGILVTCSCSYNINEGAFAEIVYEASVDANVDVTVVEKRMQGRDHPCSSASPRRTT